MKLTTKMLIQSSKDRRATERGLSNYPKLVTSERKRRAARLVGSKRRLTRKSIIAGRIGVSEQRAVNKRNPVE